jgi:hypothetical protein
VPGATRGMAPRVKVRAPLRLALILTVVMTAPFALGCGRVERARECKRLAQTVNPRLDQIAARTRGAQTPAALRAIAGDYDGIARDLAPLVFAKKSLAEAVTDYGRQLNAAAREARRAADAKEKNEPSELGTARREVVSLTKPLMAARTRIEQECTFSR